MKEQIYPLSKDKEIIRRWLEGYDTKSMIARYVGCSRITVDRAIKRYYKRLEAGTINASDSCE